MKLFLINSKNFNNFDAVKSSEQSECSGCTPLDTDPLVRNCNSYFADEFDENSAPDTDANPKPKMKKDQVKFTRAECDLNAWAKPSAPLVCGKCGIPMPVVA